MKRTGNVYLFAVIFALMLSVSVLLCLHFYGRACALTFDNAAAPSVSRHDGIAIGRILEDRSRDDDRPIAGRLSGSGLPFVPSISIGIDIEALREDIRCLDLLNEDEQRVIDATYISAYKQVLVIKLPMGYNGASFGAIFIGDKIRDAQTVRHEYGHTRQLRDMGLYLYIVDVAIPSVLGNLLDRMERLPYDYYGSYWESGADELGNVMRSTNNKKWPLGADSSIWKLCEMFG